jgi:hypothetical protein
LIVRLLPSAMIIPLPVELSACRTAVMASIQCSGVFAAAWIAVTIREYSSIVTIATSWLS